MCLSLLISPGRANLAHGFTVSFSRYLLPDTTMTAEATPLAQWKEHVADKLRRRDATIPSEWAISPLPESQANVMDVPGSCGLLSDEELEITTVSDVSVLLGKLAAGEWSAVEVTTAFSKRAVIAHQAVRVYALLQSLRAGMC